MDEDTKMYFAMVLGMAVACVLGGLLGLKSACAFAVFVLVFFGAPVAVSEMRERRRARESNRVLAALLAANYGDPAKLHNVVREYARRAEEPR